MRCQQCEAEGLPHKVFDGEPRQTPGKLVKFWDESHNRHVHSSVRTLTPLRCSNGHQWSHEGRLPCPTCGVPTDPE